MKNGGLGFTIFEKGQILRPFSGLADSKLKIFQQKIRVGYVYTEESFDFQFSIWVMGWAYIAPPPYVMGWKNRPWPKDLIVLRERGRIGHASFPGSFCQLCT